MEDVSCHKLPHFNDSLLSRTVAQTYSLFTSLVDVDGLLDHISLVRLVRQFLITLLNYGKALFLYCVESLRWISASGIPSTHKNHTISGWFSLAPTES